MNNKKVCLENNVWDANNDIISNLPDAIIQHILSFLDTKYVVRTCVLSRRWQYLWTNVPCLNFGLAEFPPANFTRESRNHFLNFMHQVLSRRCNSDIQKFSCTSNVPIDVSRLSSVIDRAVSCNVQIVDITYSNNVVPPYTWPKILLEPFKIPHLLFTSKSLRVLKLTAFDEGSISFPKNLVFISLKELHLTRISLWDKTTDREITDRELISECPNLEYLKLDDCRFGDLQSLKITAAKPLNLEILNPFIGYTRTSPWKCNIVVSSPNLATFKYHSHLPLVCSLGNPLSIGNVDINIWKCFETKSSTYDEEVGRRMIALLLAFQHAKSITLSTRALKILRYVPGRKYQPFPPFCNLKNFRVNLTDSSIFNALNSILHNSPEGKAALISPSFRFTKENKKVCLENNVRDANMNNKKVLENNVRDANMNNKKVLLENNVRDANSDRISNLPDVILQLVLSFLDTKYVVQTSVLSRRWKYLWTNVSSLNFGLEAYPPANCTDQRRNSFVNFMHQVLLRRCNSDIHKFSCYSRVANDVSHLSSCINHAVRCNVQIVDITYSNMVIRPNRKPKIFLDPFEIPHLLSTSKTLCVLKLTACDDGGISFPTNLAFISLKELHLKRISLWDKTTDRETTDRELISECPNLEYLSMVNCRFGELQSLKITAAQLFNFEILNPYGNSTRHSPWNCNIILSSPNLSSFKYSSHIPLVCSTGNPLNIDNVDIHIWKYYISKSCEYDQEMGRRMTAMLLEFQHAKSVTLSSRAMKILRYVPERKHQLFTQFCNLKNFRVNLKDSSCLHELNNILHNSPEAKTTLIAPSFRFIKEDKAKR